MAKKLRRDYGNEYPSVTQVLGILRKIGLENWFKYNTAKFCRAESDKGKLIGTQIHEGIHDLIQNNEIKVKTEYSDEVMNALNSFMAFRKKYPEITLENSEIAMTSELYKYNGTLDCKGMEGSVPILLDWKTGKAKEKDEPTIYDESKYQTAAYVKAFNETWKADIHKAIIVSLTKDKVAFTRYDMDQEEINDCFNEVFIPTLRIYNYQRRK